MASKLREHITSVSLALKYYVQEYIFVLCDEDGKKYRNNVYLCVLATEYVRIVGFGDASGLLMDRKLFGALGGGSNSGPITPSTDAIKEEEVEEEEEEEEREYDSEEERQAEELAMKIQRLQELGVIQVMKN